MAGQVPLQPPPSPAAGMGTCIMDVLPMRASNAHVAILDSPQPMGVFSIYPRHVPLCLVWRADPTCMLPGRPSRRRDVGTWPGAAARRCRRRWRGWRASTCAAPWSSTSAVPARPWTSSCSASRSLRRTRRLPCCSASSRAPSPPLPPPPPPPPPRSRSFTPAYARLFQCSYPELPLPAHKNQLCPRLADRHCAGSA